MRKYAAFLFTLQILLFFTLSGIDAQPKKNILNKPERLEWFRDLGLGMFIHWSIDSQIGSVISHSLVGASEDYVRRFVNKLPASFNPGQFNPKAWARLARLAGMRYVVFTAKHHSGFCMFESRTNRFNIMHTPYGSDIMREILDAFRSEGLATGIYFSPDDFYVLHTQGKTISRIRPEAQPRNNPGLMESNLAQMKELLTGYGPIDILFIDAHDMTPDAEPKELRELAWRLQPDIVVTRGAMETPEQQIPGSGFADPWEACFTLGTQWQYKPTNEEYKSGRDLIRMFIEIRAKGGNFLLNVGPKPDGEIPIEQEERIRELALWNFINGEAVFEIEPWYTPSELLFRTDGLYQTNDIRIWYTKKKRENTVYAIITGIPDWKLGEWKIITLKKVRTGDSSDIQVLGQNDKVLEYTNIIPKTTWEQDDNGLHVKVMRAQRIYNNRAWPNPIVLKITNALRGE